MHSTVPGTFLHDVITGLSAKEKFLQSKYFYDEAGDKLFQQIMACPEYYLTDCEMEIFTCQSNGLVELLAAQHEQFDIVELGAGDATKSVHLLKRLAGLNIDFTYYPVDISQHVIEHLTHSLPQQIPGLKVHGMNGEYLEMLEQVKALSAKPKVVLFLGSNIGNVPLEKAQEFCAALHSHLRRGDIALIGFDLKKDPHQILDAYNDQAGITRQFNLNLLQRINKELGGNFNTGNFYHYPVYDPQTGTCKSYIVSNCNQQVRVADKLFFFTQGETIFMEISQKYSAPQTDALAVQTGFTVVKHFYDSKKWFLDAVWKRAH